MCIIQDDPEDWQNEAAAMAVIYSNSYLTIAAAEARDSRAGLYATSGFTCGFKKLDREKTSLSIDVYAQRIVPHVNERNDFPLLKRAWVYQERILSSRILYFAGAELNWECKTERWCECGGIDSAWCDKLEVEKKWEELEEQMITDPDLDSLEIISRRNRHFRFWIELVQGYLSLNLTFPKDIFPTIEGIAKQVQRISNDVYLAGLWRSSLVEGLSWY